MKKSAVLRGMAAFVLLAAGFFAYGLSQSIPVLRFRAEHGSVWAMHRMGMIYSITPGALRADHTLLRYRDQTPDYAEANKWYRMAADAGDAQSQYDLAVSYSLGTGIQEDHALAAEWYKKSAAQGFAPAELRVGVIYVQGDGVPQDAAYGARMIQSAVNDGALTGKFYMANLYLNGIGVKKSYSAAKKALEDFLAEYPQENLAAGERMLGMMYLQGQGMNPDAETAARYLWKAARDGDMEAQFQMARLLLTGYGVERNEKLARYLLDKAVKQGSVDAQSMIDHMDSFNKQVEAAEAAAQAAAQRQTAVPAAQQQTAAPAEQTAAPAAQGKTPPSSVTQKP